MSETVHYTGKIEKVNNILNETLEELCERVLKENGYTELGKYYDSWEKMLFEELYEKYVIANGEIYKVIEKTYRSIDEDIFEAHDNRDGTINYEVMYYNGGCSFNEAIKEAISNMKVKG